jgi:hypothetical protein
MRRGLLVFDCPAFIFGNGFVVGWDVYAGVAGYINAFVVGGVVVVQGVKRALSAASSRELLVQLAVWSAVQAERERVAI